MKTLVCDARSVKLTFKDGNGKEIEIPGVSVVSYGASVQVGAGVAKTGLGQAWNIDYVAASAAGQTMKLDLGDMASTVTAVKIRRPRQWRRIWDLTLGPLAVPWKAWARADGWKRFSRRRKKLMKW